MRKPESLFGATPNHEKKFDPEQKKREGQINEILNSIHDRLLKEKDSYIESDIGEKLFNLANENKGFGEEQEKKLVGIISNYLASHPDSSKPGNRDLFYQKLLSSLRGCVSPEAIQFLMQLGTYGARVNLAYSYGDTDFKEKIRRSRVEEFSQPLQGVSESERNFVLKKEGPIDYDKDVFTSNHCSGLSESERRKRLLQSGAGEFLLNSQLPTTYYGPPAMYHANSEVIKDEVTCRCQGIEVLGELQNADKLNQTLTLLWEKGIDHGTLGTRHKETQKTAAKIMLRLLKRFGRAYSPETMKKLEEYRSQKVK